MAAPYGTHASKKRTPQTSPIPGREAEMKENNAGGYTFVASDWDQLMRFLIIGSVGGTYYVNERKLTLDNTAHIKNLITEKGKDVVDEVVRVSDQGLALRNDPALFVLALCAADGNKEVRSYALSQLPKVARTATHLFTFISYVKEMRGWGRALHNAVANWYQDRKPTNLAYQMVKYRNREGFTHFDVLRLSKPKPKDAEHDFLYGYASGKVVFKNGRFVKITKHKDSGEVSEKNLDMPAGLSIVKGVELIKQPGLSTTQVVNLISDYGLTHEMIPNEYKSAPAVWEALLTYMPMTAMIRNLGKMTSVGLVKPMSDASKLIVNKLSNQDYLQKSRIHPIAVLSALKIYANGAGFKGSLTWNPVQTVEDALDKAFYKTFKNVEPTGMNTMLALDVSGSMSWNKVMGIEFMMCSELTAAMALVTANVEPNYMIFGFADRFRELPVKASDSLVQATAKVANMTFGGTNCALPMKYAQQHKLDVDSFFIYTDNETWAGGSGDGHPSQALQAYRKSSGKAARMAVIAAASTSFTIADPKDPGMMDICGFSADTPKVLSEFSKGNL